MMSEGTSFDWEIPMAKRFVTRVELTAPTRRKLDAFTNSTGMTQVAVVSRLVEWFATQPDLVQATILGRYPGAVETDVHRLVLTQMASENS
jgi:hypothetical protein